MIGDLMGHSDPQTRRRYKHATDQPDRAAGRNTARTHNQGAAKLTDALDVAIQMASALTAAHAVGVVPRDILPRAEAAARKALELDEGLAEAHWALGQIKRHTWDWAAAEREYKRAIELKSNFARAYLSYANHLSLTGRHEQAMAEIKKAREFDPLPTAVNTHVGYRLFFARCYDEAIEALKQTLELTKTYPLIHIVLGYVYAEKGMYREAISAYQGGD